MRSRDIHLSTISQDIPQPSITKISLKITYRKVSNISRTLVGNKIVDHSDVVGASPVGAAPTTSSFSTYYTWLQWIGQRQLQDVTRNIYVLGLDASYIREFYIRELTVSKILFKSPRDQWVHDKCPCNIHTFHRNNWYGHIYFSKQQYIYLLWRFLKYQVSNM